MQAIRLDIKWHPGFSIYASERFLKSVSDEYGWIGGLDVVGTLRCILPYTIVRKATVRMARFRVETIPLRDRLDPAEEKLFLNSAVEFLRSAGAHLVIPASTNTIFNAYPDGAIAAPYGSYIIDLSHSEEELWKHVHSKHRNVIRKAEKMGVNIASGIEYARQAYQLIRDTFKRSSHTFMDRSAFERMISGLEGNVKIFIADFQGVLQGCAVIPFSQSSAYYVYGGSIPHPQSGATNLMQWEAIRHFRSLGVKRYDFCGARIDPPKGSKQASLSMYKERFGGQLHRGYMWKYYLNPLKSAIYRVAIHLLRGGDIVAMEHHKLPAS